MAAAAAAGGAAEVENITIVSAEGERFTVPKKVGPWRGAVDAQRACGTRRCSRSRRAHLPR